MPTEPSSQMTESPPDVLFSAGKPRTEKVLAYIIVGAGVLLVFVHLYTATFTQIHPWVQRHFLVSTILVMGFLLRPLGRKSWNSKLNLWFLVDLAFIAISVGAFLYVLATYDKWIISMPSLTTAELVIASAFTIAVMELTRRVVGWALTALAALFIIANTFAPHFPPPFYGPAVAWKHQISMIYSEMDGMFGIPIGVMVGFIILFFFFAALLRVCGAGDIIMNFALALTGRYAGGPAKVAVLSSSFFGSMSGSPMSNVMATGSFTIPMMKKMGFKPTMAGAVEAAASTGGQFMPPIMGETAFIIPSFLGVSYFRLCVAVLIPTLLYYTGLFLQIHLEAKKYGLEGLPAIQLPRLLSALKPTWVIFVPILGIFYFLWQGYGLGRVALYGIVLMLLCALISRAKPRLTARSILAACHEAADMAVLSGAACATAGIIIGTFYTSGLGDKLSFAIVDLATGSVWPAVFLTAIVCVILGMGVPTPAIYITMVLITIPALVHLGVVPIAAHMFTFFMGVSSGLTPPVCLTAYVAGSLAGAPMMRTGVTAFRLSIVGYLVAFAFIACPELLMIGPPNLIIYRLIFALAGVVALAIGLEGYLTRDLGWIARLLFIAVAVACWWPYSMLINVIGVALVVTLILAYGRWYKEIFQITHKTQ